MFGGVVVFLFVSLLAEINGQDDCMANPCMNGGVCNDPLIGCENCQDGFMGYFCQQGIIIYII